LSTFVTEILLEIQKFFLQYFNFTLKRLSGVKARRVDKINQGKGLTVNSINPIRRRFFDQINKTGITLQLPF